jgi:hypothetical protein
LAHFFAAVSGFFSYMENATAVLDDPIYGNAREVKIAN